MTSTFTDLSLLRPTIPSLVPSSFPKFTTHIFFILCCSLTEGSATFLPFKLNGEAQSSAGHSATTDYVIVGGGISGLCIAQALATNHRDVAPNVIFTESRDCVGGYITTLERDVISGVYAGDPSKLSMKAAFGKVWNLGQTGGSNISGTFKTIQERSENPKPPRDPSLPTPKGQTVGSFRK